MIGCVGNVVCVVGFYRICRNEHSVSERLHRREDLLALLFVDPAVASLIATFL